MLNSILVCLFFITSILIDKYILLPEFLALLIQDWTVLVVAGLQLAQQHLENSTEESKLGLVLFPGIHPPVVALGKFPPELNF